MIKFKQVKFKNFGSFGNYITTIDFGENEMTLVTGSNGHGKSYALLDSITFALFGKPFRKINIPQLVNSINQKNCLVELYFCIGSDEYKVIRGLKPKKFEIYKNDELIKQNAKSKDYQKFLEEQILKMNYKSFTQIVTLGSSSFIPFMQLTPADRREVIEDILDINIFSTMNVVIKGKISSLKEQIKEKSNEIELLQEKIKIQEQNISSLNKNKNENIKNNLEKIQQANQEITSIVEEVSKLEVMVNDLPSHEESQKSLERKMTKKKDAIVDTIKDRKNIEKSVLFYNENENCPVCSQTLSNEFKNKKIEELNNEIKDKETEVEKLKQDLGLK